MHVLSRARQCTSTLAAPAARPRRPPAHLRPALGDEPGVGLADLGKQARHALGVLLAVVVVALRHLVAAVALRLRLLQAHVEAAGGRGKGAGRAAVVASEPNA